jgi:hypothetical protein
MGQTRLLTSRAFDPPFTFTIYFMLRQRDILMVNVHTAIQSNLAEIFVRRPLARRYTKHHSQT